MFRFAFAEIRNSIPLQLPPRHRLANIFELSTNEWPETFSVFDGGTDQPRSFQNIAQPAELISFHKAHGGDHGVNGSNVKSKDLTLSPR